MPQDHDFVAIRGNDLPIQLRLAPLDATGAQFDFVCRGPRRPNRLELRRSTQAGTIAMSVDTGSSAGPVTVLDFKLAPEDTRQLGEGRVNPYELELRGADGTEQTLLSGMITATGGVNADA